jgi:polyphosphate kinase
VEAVAPVDDVRLQGHLRSLLRTCLEDNRQAWELQASGKWHQRKPVDHVRSAHVRLLADSWGEASQPIGNVTIPDAGAARAQPTAE